MGALSGGGLWGMLPFQSHHSNRRRPRPSRRPSKPFASVASTGGAALQFPFKQAITAGALALTGDTFAQFHRRWVNRKSSLVQDSPSASHDFQDVMQTLVSNHDWVRALRMATYGFLLYGPGSYAWYQYLDYCMPKQTVRNLFTKVLLNQVILGPCVIAVIFAWNNLWEGKLAELPSKYQKDAIPTLFFGFRFWIPVTVLNFWVVPLQARVAFMCTGSIFWNYYLSSTMSK